MIILLNGCGSSGKTSIARSIQHLSDDLWLTFGVDTFIEMTVPPSDNQKETWYFNFIPGENGPKANQLFVTMPSFAKLLADRDNNLIIDEVIFDAEVLQEYAINLKDHIVYFVGVFCDLATMQKREISRGDRAIGLSNDQIDRVHAGVEYDLKVDTTSNDSFTCAKAILDFISDNPQPMSFHKMHFLSKYNSCII